jgi:hypothetical protein
MAVFLAKIPNVGTASYEDPEALEAEHCDQGDVVDVGRRSGGRDQRFELPMSGAEGGRLGWYERPADVVGGRARQDLVDDADPV